MTLWGV
jgi:hypothetical protein